jgi:hypothetical protein
VPCTDGLPARVDGNIDSHWIAADGSFVACALPNGSVMVSEDAGATWRELASGLRPIHAVLAVAP